MAANQQEKQTTPQTDQPGEMDRDTSPARQGSAGTTITIPSIQGLPGMGEALEPKHLLWFGGLAVAGAIGVLEWPVVAAVGVGSYVAERFAKSRDTR